MGYNEDLKARLQRIKQNFYSENANAKSYKDIIKKAIKYRFPGIPERANDALVSKLMDLDNNEILQMGKDTIKVEDLIDDIIEIIFGFIVDLDDENLR